MASGFIGVIQAGSTLTVKLSSLTKVMVSCSSSGSFTINGVTAIGFSSTVAPLQQIVYVAPGTWTFGAVTVAITLSCIEEAII